MAPEDSQSILVAIISLFGGGGIATIFMALLGRRKTKAEAVLIEANADKVVMSSALEYVKAIREEAADLRRRAMDQEARAEILERKTKLLEEHVLLQEEFIQALRQALSEYNQHHPLLKKQFPKPPLK